MNELEKILLEEEYSQIVNELRDKLVKPIKNILDSFVELFNSFTEEQKQIIIDYYHKDKMIKENV